MIEKTATGITGLDDILNGGIPKGRVVLITGGPGAGKSILCTQFLVNGIKKYRENGVFVFLGENRQHFYEEMAALGMNLAELEMQGTLACLDASILRRVPAEVTIGGFSVGKREFSMLSLLDQIRDAVKNLDAKRVVIDPISSFILAYPNAHERRIAMLDILNYLANNKTTCLVTSELRNLGLNRRIEMEEYVSQGTIVLQTLKIGKGLIRTIMVEKLRGTAHDTQPRPYRITNNGIEVLARENILI